MNSINIIGNLTADPELKYTASGTELCSFSIAHNKVYKKDGEKVEQVYFFNCEAWSGIAKTITEYFKKGHKIGITGELKQDRWETESGEKRQTVKIVVRGIDFLTPKNSTGESADNNSAPIPQSPFSDDDIPF
jgi:single-strand DNA-binding protein